MPPITWRNVAAPTAQGASRILEAAGKSFNRGAAGLTGLVNQVGDVNSANIANQNAINTQSALSQIAGLDLAGVTAAQESGLFGAGNLPIGVDQQAIDKAFTARPNVIADQLAKTNANQVAAQNRAEAGPKVELQNLISSGDLAGAQALLDTGVVQNESPFNKAIAGSQASTVAAQRKEAEFQRQEQARIDAPAAKVASLQTEAAIASADVNLQQQLAELPVDKAVTTKQQGISQGDAFNSLRAFAPNKTFYDSQGDSGGTELIDRISEGVKTIEDGGQEVPGYILDEVTKLIQAESGGEQGAWFSFDRSVDADRYIELVKARLSQSKVSDDNKIKRAAARRGNIATNLQSEIELANR